MKSLNCHFYSGRFATPLPSYSGYYSNNSFFVFVKCRYLNFPFFSPPPPVYPLILATTPISFTSEKCCHLSFTPHSSISHLFITFALLLSPSPPHPGLSFSHLTFLLPFLPLFPSERAVELQTVQPFPFLLLPLSKLDPRLTALFSLDSTF